MKATLDMIRTAHRTGIFFSRRKSQRQTFNWTVFYIKETKRDIAVSSWRRSGDIFLRARVSLEIIYNIKSIQEREKKKEVQLFLLEKRKELITECFCIFLFSLSCFSHQFPSLLSCPAELLPMSEFSRRI